MNTPHPSTDVEEKGKSKILEMYAIAHYPTKFHPDYDLVLRAIDAERICKDLLTTQATTHQATLAEVTRCQKRIPGNAICGCKLDCHLHDWRQKDLLAEVVDSAWLWIVEATREQQWDQKEFKEYIAKKHSIPLTDDKPPTT